MLIYLIFMNPQISQISQIVKLFSIGCVKRTATVKFELNDVAEAVTDGAPSAPYTSTANPTFNLRGHLC
jgi:hypothetical protein